MTGGDIHMGDNVTMYGGQGNQGIVHHTYAPPATLEERLTEVVRLARALRATGIDDATDRAALDDALPVLAPGAAPDEPARRGSLRALAGIAATVGAVGEPLLNSVKAALELMGR
jgi:hypothetical protein